MDEILIEEKKYISSKRAAKITGYAKDYIGQLCREGRVPARLVGRSWYVLETAIQDHRFGDMGGESVKSKKEAARSESSPTAFPSTWEAPRYEASSVEFLPSFNRLQSTETPIPAETRDDNEFSQRLQDSWRAWFDRAEPAIPDDMLDMPSPEPVKILEGEADMPERDEDKGVEIPIHSVYEPIITESLPPIAVAVEPQQRGEERPIYQEERRGKRSLLIPMQLAGMFFAFIMAIMAIIGSGYFDEYILSSSQASIIAGVSLYNK